MHPAGRGARRGARGSASRGRARGPSPAGYVAGLSAARARRPDASSAPGAAARRARRAGAPSAPAPRAPSRAAPAATPGASASEPASALRRWANPACTRSRTASSGAGPRRRMRHEHGVHVRGGVEHGARDLAQHAHLAGELGEHGASPRNAAAGLGREPLAHLALDHRHPQARARQLGDRLEQDRRGDAVGQVGHDLRGRRAERAEVELHGVGQVERRVLERGERLRERRARASGPPRPRAGGATRGARCSESTPSPPPTSSTTSPGSSSAARSITPSRLSSIRKFWPSSRFGPHVEPAQAPQARLARLAHQPNTRAALASTARSSSS